MSNINTQGFGIQLAPAGFSLEANKIFGNYAAVLEFVKTKPAAYVGSIIAVLAPSTIDGTTYPKGAYMVDAVGENAVLTQVGKETSFSIVKAETADEGYSATYQIVRVQNSPSGATISIPVEGAAKINIPKDMVVSKGEIVVFTADNLIPGVSEPGTYIRLELANAQDPIYINVNDLVDAGEFIELQNRVRDLDSRLIRNDIFTINIGNATELLSRLSVASPKVLVTTSLEEVFTVRLSEQISTSERMSVLIEKDSQSYPVEFGSATVPIAYGRNRMYLVVSNTGEGSYRIKKPFSIVVLPPIALGVSTDKETLPTSSKTTLGYPYDDSYHVHEVTFGEPLTMEADGHLCVILPTGGGYDSLLSVSIAGYNVPMEATNKMEVSGLMSFIYHSVDKLKKGTYDNIVLTVKDSVM